MQRLVHAFDAAKGTRSRKAKVASLSALLATLSRDELPIAARLMLGQLLPTGDARALGVGWALLSQVAAELSGQSVGAVGLKTRELGDFGEALEHLLPRRNTHLPLLEVPPIIERLASSPDREVKRGALLELFGRAAPWAPFVGQPNATCSPPLNIACGNGIVERVSLTDGGTSAEACDDGNTTANDGCSPTCTVETGYLCGPPQVSNCLPLAPVISAPVTGSRLNDSTPDFSGTGVAGLTVTVRVDGASVCTATVQAGGTWSCTSSALVDGTRVAVATQADSGNRTSADSNTVTFTLDSVAPATPTVLAPANGSRTNDSTPSVSGTAEAGSTVRVFIDTSGMPACTATAAVDGRFSCDVGAALSEGQHTVRVSATDAANNTSGLSSTNTFVVDLSAPSAPVILLPVDGSTTNDSTPTISGTAEANASVTLFFDGSTTAGCTTTASALGTFTCEAPALAEGLHTVRARATDLAGNVSSQSTQVGFTVDSVAPTAPSVTAPAPGTTVTTTTPRISGRAEAGSTVRVSVNGVQVCTAVASVSGDYSCTSSALNEGNCSVSATATDAAGNVSPASTPYTFIVDSIAPVTPVVSAPANGSSTSDNTPTISGSGEVGSTVRVFIDGSTTATCTAVVAPGGTWSCTTGTLSDAIHTVRASAIDGGGNVSGLSNQNSFRVDATPPAAPVITVPANTSSTSDTTPTISGTAEANSQVNVFLDGNGSAICSATASSSGAWSCTTPVLSEGNHTLRALATDGVNTSPQSAQVAFSIDTSPPASPVVVVPAEGSVTGDATPTVSGTAEANATVQVFVDGGAVAACTATASSSGAWSCDVSTALSDGPHTVRALAADAAANSSALSAVRAFRVDLTAPAAPVIASPADESFTSDSTPAVSGTAEAGATIAVFIGASTVPACTTTVTAAGTFECSVTPALADGRTSVRAVATDAVGNASPSSAANDFTVDTAAPAAPQVTSPANGSTTADTTPTYSGTAEANALVSVFVDGSTTAACTVTASSSGSFSCTPTTPLSEGNHTVRASATDATANASALSAAVTFTVDTTPPTVPTIVAPAANAVLSDTTPTVSGTGEAGATVRVFLDADTTAACTATVTSTGAWSCDVPTPLMEGAHTARATAVDAGGNVSTATPARPFSIDTAGSPAPTITAPAAGASVADATPTVRGTGEGGDTIRVFVDGATSPACTAVVSNTGSWSCDVAPALAEGAHVLRAVAVDGAGNLSPPATRAFSVDLSAPATPVVLAPLADATTSASPTFSGTAEPDSAVSVSVDGAEVCTAVASTSGNFACVATTPLSPGAHSATATARDSAGNSSGPSASRPFTVGSAIPPGPPVVSQPAANAVVADTTPSVGGSAEPGSTVRVFIDGSATPACTATATAQGAFSCEVSPALGEGAHVVVATATTSAGSSGPSAPVRFTIDSAAPLAPSITAPVANATTGERPVITGTAEPLALVEVFIDGGLTPSCTARADAAGAFACAPSAALSVGPHNVTARASDAASNASPLSTAVAFTVAAGQPVSAPIVSVPARDALINDSTPTFGGTATPGATVAVFVDAASTPVCSTTADALGAFSCDATTAITDGAHAVTATATVGASTSGSSPSVPFTLDTMAPMTPVVSTPVSGATTDRQPALNGTAEAGATVVVRIDGQVVCEVVASSAGQWSCVISQPLEPGAHQVTAAAVDAAKNRSAESSAVPFTVAGTPRTPVLTTPAAGSTIGDDTPTYSGVAEPGSAVTVTVDGAAVCTVTADSTGAFSCTPATALTMGAHTVTVTSVTPGGMSSSTPGTFTVGPPGPAAPVLTSPQAGASLPDATPTFSGTGEPGSTVSVRVDGAEVCTATTDAQGQFSCTPSAPLSAQPHTATAIQTTAAGTSMPSAAVSFGISTTPPVITSPTHDSEAESKPTFEGTAQPGSMVSILVDGAVVCSTTADTQGSFSCRPENPLPLGSVTVTARSVDAFGIEQTSEQLVLRVIDLRLGGGGCGCGALPGAELLLGLAVVLLGRRRR